MRVAICGPYPLDDEDDAVGDGLMQCVVTLAHGLADIGTATHVISRSTRVANVVSEDRNGVSVTWVPDPFPRADYLVGRRLLQSRLRRVIRRIRPDIVHAHGEAPFIRAALSYEGHHVITLHGLFADQTRAHGLAIPLSLRAAYLLMRRWEREYLPRIKCAIAINAQLGVSVLRANPHARVFRVNNPVASAFFDAAADDPTPSRILFLGQISRRKGLHILLEAFAAIADVIQATELRVIGGSLQDSGYYEELQSQYRHLVDDGRLVFAGPKVHRDIPSELARAAIVCLPSLYEASPLAVLEAMAAGRPVVASRVGDVDELLSGGVGVVVEPGDPRALASALIALLRDASGGREMGRRARASARQRASPNVVAQETQSVYEAILGREDTRAFGAEH
jgi:glycosyltransferase involved in cell wall biosynthesis